MSAHSAKIGDPKISFRQEGVGYLVELGDATLPDGSTAVKLTIGSVVRRPGYGGNAWRAFGHDGRLLGSYYTSRRAAARACRIYFEEGSS